MLKSLKIKLKINRKQKNIFDEWLNTSNFVYNKTVKCIQDGDHINFMSLRDKLVTANTKKNNAEYKTSDVYMNKIRIQKFIKNSSWKLQVVLIQAYVPYKTVQTGTYFKKKKVKFY